MKRHLAALVALLTIGSTNAQNTPTEVHSAVKSAGGSTKFLSYVAKETAKMLPLEINKNMQVISVVALGDMIQYTGKFSDVSKKDIRDMKEFSRQNTNYMVCRSPVMGVLINHYGIEVKYINISRENEFLFQYNLNKVTCKGK